MTSPQDETYGYYLDPEGVIPVIFVLEEVEDGAGHHYWEAKGFAHPLDLKVDWEWCCQGSGVDPTSAIVDALRRDQRFDHSKRVAKQRPKGGTP